jgi:hypothetical protein
MVLWASGHACRAATKPGAVRLAAVVGPGMEPAGWSSVAVERSAAWTRKPNRSQQRRMSPSVAWPSCGRGFADRSGREALAMRWQLAEGEL